MRKIDRWVLLMLAFLMPVVSACNKDEEIGAEFKPVITFDNESGIYTVKIGHSLTLDPVIEHGEGAEIEWTVDGEVMCRERVWTATWNVAGEYYALLTVTNRAGTAREEVRVDVLAQTPPTISLRMPEEGLKVVAGKPLELSPRYQHDDMEGFAVEWTVNGEKVCDTPDYTFQESETGTYSVVITARNIDGVTEKRFDVEVVDKMPATVRFVPLSYGVAEDVRYVFAGQPVSIRTVTQYIENTEYWWTVNGAAVDCTTSVLVFTPDAAGDYNVKVVAGDSEATMKVVCVAGSAQSRMRPVVAGSSANSNVVHEWTPAPGQFIGETSSVGGMTPDIVTHEQARTWAQGRLDSRKFVSLGAWGGCVIVGFDHSVVKGGGEYDFGVMGNAISTSNEPGIVWVMQDANGNGKPDDEWYQLRGSDYGSEQTSHDYSVTYYRPAGSGMTVEWTDCTGGSGEIDYLWMSHKQPTYYPVWVDVDSYTLYGTLLPPRNSVDPVTGFWSNMPFAWGYADNLGSDLIPGGDTESGEGQWVGFKISNAVDANGNPVELNYVDFVKIQTGIMAKSGKLGEASTEVCGVRDWNL